MTAMTIEDEFDQALDEAITEPEKSREVDFDFNDEAGGVDERPRDGEGEQQDQASNFDYAQDMARKVQEAASVRDQWKAEHDRLDAELRAAQEKYKKVRVEFVEGDATVDAELEAQDALLSARYALEKARDSYSQAARYHDYVANTPGLPPAAQAWLEANPSYTRDPRFKSNVDKLMQELRADGMDSTHQNFYRKLDEKLRTPTRMGKDSRRTPGAPAVHIRRDSQDVDRPMSQKEAEFIKNIGRDPRDKRVQEQWRNSKANTLRIARDRGFL